jgi:hypothetical protein
VLVAQGYLQVKDRLPGALEAEVAGLDDPGVHRTHGDLVHLLALDPEKLCVAARRPGRGLPRGVRLGVLEADGLEPWVAFRPDAPALEDLPLEPVSGGAFGGEGGVGVSRPRGGNPDPAGARLREHGKEGEPAVVRSGE